MKCSILTTCGTILEEEQGVLMQDNNCKLLYTENPLRIYANGEWLDEVNVIEAEVLKTPFRW